MEFSVKSGGGAFTVSAGNTIVGARLAGSLVNGSRNYALGTALSGGVAISTHVRLWGELFVSNGGTAIATTVSSGGQAFVESGGTASGTSLIGGAEFVISTGGLASGVTTTGYEAKEGVAGYGPYNAPRVLVAGTATDISIIAGAGLTVETTGVVATAVLSGLYGSDSRFYEPAYATDSGMMSGVTLEGGALLTVAAGGKAVDVTVSGAMSGGSVFSSGSAFYPTSVSDSGTVSGVTVSNLGVLTVAASGSADAITVSSAGTVTDSAGGTLSDITVLAGGSARLVAGDTVNGLIVSSGGFAELGGVISNISVDLGAHVTDVGRVVGSGEVLRLGSANSAFSASMITGGVLFGLSSALDTVVLSGGREVVSAVGQASFTTVFAGGSDTVLPDGLAFSTVLSGGTQVVSAFGSVISARVGSGGVQSVMGDGSARATTVAWGGQQIVMAGGSAISGTVELGGQQTVAASGFVSGETIFGLVRDSGLIVSAGVASSNLTRGVLIVANGGTAVSTDVGYRANMEVASEGFASDTNDYGFLTVYSGGSAAGGVDDWKERVMSGGDVGNVTLETNFGVGSAVIRIDAGGSASGVVVAGSSGIIVDSGQLVGASVGASDRLAVAAGGTATDTQVGLLGSESVWSGGTADRTTVFLGKQQVLSGGTASGTVVSLGGAVVVHGGGTLEAATIIGGGLVSLWAGAVDTTPIAFVSSGGTVAWGGHGVLGAPIAGFGLGDTIDLTGLTYASGGSATLAGDLLKVSIDGVSDKIRFAPGTDFSGTTFALASDGQSGTVLTLSAASGSLALPPAHS